jgi:ABC-2 type transport system ATP-binding protein
MAQPILQVKNLVKDFGSFRAVDGISFDVPAGKIVGFLGPNGAGKTTTIHMLLGITTPTSGAITYFGQDFASNKQAVLNRINFASAFNTLQGRITVWENLKVFAYLYGVKDPKKKIQHYADYFEISGIMNQLYKNLSAGQKTRVNLIKSLINDPKVLLLDEPTASLDPDIADKTMSLIEDLQRERGLTILYTSHNMNEITRVCDDVIFLDHGKIVAHDTPLNLTKRIKTVKLSLTVDRGAAELRTYLKSAGVSYVFADTHMVSIDAPEARVPELIIGANKAGANVIDIEVEKPSLEDVFLQIARGGSNEL